MEYQQNPRLERIGGIIISVTFTVMITLCGILALYLQPTYQATLVETGEWFTIKEPLVMGGDGYKRYEVRRSGKRTLFGEAQSGEGSRDEIDGYYDILTVWRMEAGERTEDRLLFFDPKTRQLFLTRPE